MIANAVAQSAAEYRRLAQEERNKAQAVGPTQGKFHIQAAQAYEQAARDKEREERSSRSSPSPSTKPNYSPTSPDDSINQLGNALRDSLNESFRKDQERREREVEARERRIQKEEERAERESDRRQQKDDMASKMEQLKELNSAIYKPNPNRGAIIAEQNSRRNTPHVPANPGGPGDGVRVIDYNQPAAPNFKQTPPSPTPAPSSFDADLRDFASPQVNRFNDTSHAPTRTPNPPSRPAYSAASPSPEPVQEQSSFSDFLRDEARRMKRFGNAALEVTQPVVQRTANIISDKLVDQLFGGRSLGELSVRDAASSGIDSELKNFREYYLTREQRDVLNTDRLISPNPVIRYRDHERRINDLSQDFDSFINDLKR